jgi:hypothetical protein
VFVLAPKVTVPVNTTVVNIGLILGERLYKQKQMVKINIANDGCHLGRGQSDITVANIDILFSPEYELDVIKLLLQVGRNQRLYVQWPGEIAGENLTYSEHGLFDYKEYNINNYVDTYVITS